MNAAHLHLILNHIPVLGTIFGLVLLALALGRKSEELKRVALGTFVIVALLAVPVYLTGEPAEEVLMPLPDASEPIVEQHEQAATVAFIGVVVLGISALAGLFLFRGGKVAPLWFGCAVLVMSLIVSGAMAWTANLGGQIRHEEIRPGAGLPTGGAESDHR